MRPTISFSAFDAARRRLPTRALRELLRLGLTVAPTNGDGQKSSHYGVFNRGSDGHREEA